MKNSNAKLVTPHPKFFLGLLVFYQLSLKKKEAEI